MVKTIIHVNQHKIKKNAIKIKNGETNINNLEPVITVKASKSNSYTNEVVLSDGIKVVYRPFKPLKCGAVCWVETDKEVLI